MNVPARSATPAPPYSSPCEPGPLLLPEGDPPSYRECMDEEAAVDLAEEGDITETSSLYGDRR